MLKLILMYLNGTLFAGPKCADPTALRNVLQRSLEEFRETERSKALIHKRLKRNCGSVGLHIRETPEDGSCLFHAVIDQLKIICGGRGRGKGPQQLRKEVVEFLRANPSLKVCILI